MKLQDLLKDIELGKVYTDKDRPPFKLNEDGHTDVPSAIRKLKLSIEDSQQLIQKLSTMDRETALPSWWTDKITLASNYLNKSRDYLLNSELGESNVAPGLGYSSKEAKTIVEQGIEDYAKILRKAQYKIIKDWMSKAKSGVLDFYDINRGIKTNQVGKTYPYEADFLRNVLLKDKIIDRFKKYFGGRKGKKR